MSMQYELGASEGVCDNQNSFGDGESLETSFSYETNQERVRRGLEAAALAHLDRARGRPVAFAIRSNINYESGADHNCPASDCAISFRTNDFMHIKEKFNDDWWIGRLVKESCAVGFIPSPMKLEGLRARNVNQFHSLDDELACENGTNHNGDLCERSGTRTALALGSVLLSKDKRKLFKKFEHPSPYDVVPTIRPVILIGPSLKGFEVTDMMQKAIFDFLKERFRNRIIITRVTADISLARQAEQANPIGSGGGGSRTGGVSGSGGRRQGLIDRSNNSRLMSNLTEVTFEIERVFELARTMQLVVLDCDTINHPEQMAKTSLAPILVYLKVASSKVLQRLIKSRGRGQARQINAQMSASEKLNQLPHEAFDVVLDENQLDEACDHLADYLENYWRAIHLPPPVNSNSASNSSSQSNGVDMEHCRTINEPIADVCRNLNFNQPQNHHSMPSRSDWSTAPIVQSQPQYHHQMSLPDQHNTLQEPVYIPSSMPTPPANLTHLNYDCELDGGC